MTTGGSAIKAAQKIRDVGYIVEEVICIVDRQVDDEANKLMKSNNLKLTSIFQLHDIVYGR